MDPNYCETWFQIHIKVQIRSITDMKRFWDVQVTKRATEGMSRLQGTRTLGANLSLSHSVEPISTCT